MRPKPMTKDEIEGIVSKAVDEAVDFIDSDVAPDRIKAQRYFDGQVDLGHEDGRSGVVATKVRDAVRAIKPSLMRVFTATDKPVEFVPHGPEDVQAAEMATKFASYKFGQNNGFRVLQDVFHDALVKKAGIAKAYYDETPDVEFHDFDNLSDEEFALLVDDDDVEVVEHTETIEIEVDEMGVEVERPYHSAKIARTTTKGDIKIESVPPEEFFVDRNARSIDDYYVIGNRNEMRVGDLVALGFDIEEVMNLGGYTDADTTADEAEFERRGYTVDDDESEDARDPSMRRVLVTEAYMKMDIEGTGVPRLYYFILGGGGYKLLDYDVADEAPYSVFEVDPEPHAFFGRSIADLLIYEQDAATSMLRGVLDNVALTNNPGTEIVDGQVNIDDLLNNEIGRVVRVKQPGAMRELAVPFTAGSTLPALQYFDQSIEAKTGISRAAQGLDPDVLQSASATAVAATTEAASGQIEVIARNLAEGGMKRLFKIVLSLIIKNADDEQMIRLDDQFVPIDPRAWNADMDMSVNVGIGTSREQEKAAVLREVFNYQTQMWQAYGPSNGLVTMTQMRNTLADMLATSGVNNASRYFMPMDPQTEQLLTQQAAQAAQQSAQGGSDPNQAYMAAEQMKAQSRMQVDMAKLQLEGQKAMAEEQRKRQEMLMDDDQERDQMVQDLAVKVAEILGKYGTQVDVARVQAEQAAPRNPMGGFE